ncbi:hypothetical protein CROQUDRAFT_463154 [Cronartium quercuum f. sp. fusiforme G11]|uniref:RNase H type-1 domain-containing protein n=1 Tax=Cronartium quercuum f. sp. fusiforme G11 TaxID=708437 RepID=A0A9P6NT25_9BASI|nr:hypothetical protein CROQUDRAFT_463154 [Cronartium quercuum f. sp. fusiforme G11]
MSCQHKSPRHHILIRLPNRREKYRSCCLVRKHKTSECRSPRSSLQARHIRGVIKDIATSKTNSPLLTNKTEALTTAYYINRAAPHIKITLRWCPGHKDILGNERVNQLAKKATSNKLPNDHIDKPSLASFRASIKARAKSSPRVSTNDIKRLCHKPQPKKIFKGLTELKNKHSIASITQLRSGHIPLFQYLHSRNLRPSPDCICDTGSETVDHFLFICSIHRNQRTELKKKNIKNQITLQQNDPTLTGSLLHRH